VSFKTKPLAGRVAIVTGSSRGLGKEFAIAMASAGARVVINGRQPDEAAAVCDHIAARGGEAIVASGSVTDEFAVANMVDATLARWGRVDILINNAGFAIDKTFGRITMEEFQEVMDVHVGGAARCSHAVWPHMVSKGYGRIIMITSASGLTGNFGQSAYGAAKMAVIGLMNNLGLEGSRKGIRVNSFAPIGITDLNREVIDVAFHDRFRPEKLAPGVLFLASEEAPNQCVLAGGAGSFERIHFSISKGTTAGTVEQLAERFEQLSSLDRLELLTDIRQQMRIELNNSQ
jgi:NAD(P)-dependent dehydrogenase (short-subunit alcohol dehydrogenase family)